MDDPNKKVNQEETEANKDESIQLTEDNLEKVAGGADFCFWDRERKNQKNHGTALNRNFLSKKKRWGFSPAFFWCARRHTNGRGEGETPPSALFQ